MLGSEDYRWLFVARLNTNDALTLVRIGMISAQTNPAPSGMYFEKLAADTNWYCVTRLASSETRVDTGVAVTTDFATFAASKTAAGAVFSLNGVAVCGGAIATTIPSLLMPIVLINNGEAASKTIDIDYFEQRITVSR